MKTDLEHFPCRVLPSYTLFAHNFTEFFPFTILWHFNCLFLSCVPKQNRKKTNMICERMWILLLHWHTRGSFVCQSAQSVIRSAYTLAIEFIMDESG